MSYAIYVHERRIEDIKQIVTIEKLTEKEKDIKNEIEYIKRRCQEEINRLEKFLPAIGEQAQRILQAEYDNEVTYRIREVKSQNYNKYIEYTIYLYKIINEKEHQIDCKTFRADIESKKQKEQYKKDLQLKFQTKIIEYKDYSRRG